MVNKIFETALVISAFLVFGEVISTTATPSSFETERSMAGLEFDLIAGYEPNTLVTDENAIDLDLQMIQKLMAPDDSLSNIQMIENRGIASRVYENGAFSGTVATVTLTEKLTRPLPKGLLVIGTGKDSEVRGILQNNQKVNDTIVKIEYEVSKHQEDYVGCHVGGNPHPETDGCFRPSGTLTIQSYHQVGYNYDIYHGNKHERSIQGFSKSAEQNMLNCKTCPHDDFEKFHSYYGHSDYGDKFATAAKFGGFTDLSFGNADYSKYSEEGKAEAFQKSIVLLILWMQVIHEMEVAVNVECNQGCDTYLCNEGAVHNWDTAAAFYTGSLEGEDGKSKGLFLHQIADDLCSTFSTCGQLGKSNIGTSFVNREILRQFQTGQRHLTNGECSEAGEAKQRIIQMMKVPLIQGALYHAKLLEDTVDVDDTIKAAGSIYGAAVLPFFNSCGSGNQQVYANLKATSKGTDFADMKQALESRYECMQVECHHVGGIFDSATHRYVQGAEPCGFDLSSVDQGMGVELIIGYAIGGLAALSILVLGIIYLTKPIPSEIDEQDELLGDDEESIESFNDEDDDDDVFPVLLDPRKIEAESGLV